MKKIFVLIAAIILTLTAFTGCVELEPTDSFPEDFAANHKTCN